MLSHKDVWNAVVHSRETWPFGHPLHELDVMVLGIFLFVCFMTWVMALEWKFGRWSRSLKTAKIEDLPFIITREQWLAEGGNDD